MQIAPVAYFIPIAIHPDRELKLVNMDITFTNDMIH